MTELPRDLLAAERAISSTTAIRQVVQAVWTLARAQQPKVEAACGEALEYLHWVERLVARFGGETPLEEPGDALWVLVGPERPFCGGYARRLVEQLPDEGRLLFVGARLLEVLAPTSPLRARLVRVLPAATGPDDIDIAARGVAEVLLELAHAGPVAILHPTGGGMELERASLLARGPRLRGDLPETYSPAFKVLEAAVHEAVAGRLVVGIAEALRSEVRARLLASEAARHGADRKLAELGQHLRVLRQEAVTGELLELFAGRLTEAN